MGRRIVPYRRVSTVKQGESGLGLEAQDEAIAAYCRMNDCKTVATYTEVETAKKDEMENRPELVKGIAHAKRAKAVLVIAKLDRLSRSVYVTAQLHKTGVEFVACDNPHANRMTIQILAVMAEHEALMISARTKGALAAYKAGKRVSKRIRLLYPDGVPADVVEATAGKLRAVPAPMPEADARSPSEGSDQVGRKPSSRRDRRPRRYCASHAGDVERRKAFASSNRQPPE